MKALIVQGPGLYGVNIRVVPDAVGEDLIQHHGVEPKEGEPFYPRPLTGLGHSDFTVVLAHMEADKSFGFDSGGWDEGEQIIDRAIAGFVMRRE